MVNQDLLSRMRSVGDPHGRVEVRRMSDLQRALGVTMPRTQLHRELARLNRFGLLTITSATRRQEQSGDSSITERLYVVTTNGMIFLELCSLKEISCIEPDPRLAGLQNLSLHGLVSAVQTTEPDGKTRRVFTLLPA